jgi:hypothetical protein
MPFTISPGVITKEIDLTTVVPEISMTEGAIAGPLQWGPAYDRVTVSNESELASTFGKPNAATYKTYFTAASYLAYSGNLKVVRTPNTSDTKNATMDASNTVYIANDEAYENTYDPAMGGTAVAYYGAFVGKWTGDLGNSLRVSMCGATRANTNSDGTLNSNTDTPLTGSSFVYTIANTTLLGVGSLFDSQVAVGDTLFYNSKSLVVTAVTSNTVIVASGTADIANTGLCDQKKRSAFGTPAADMLGTVGVSANGVTITGVLTALNTQYTVGDIVKLTTTGEERKVSAITNSTIMTVSEPFSLAAVANTHSRKWEYASAFDSEPVTSSHAKRNGGNFDEIHVVVVDEDGEFTGANNTVVETFTGSVAAGAKGEDGQSIFYKDLVNRGSKYVRWMDHHANGDADTKLAGGTTAWGGVASGTFNGKGIIVSASLTGGAAGTAATAGNIQTGYDLYKNAEEVDVTLIMTADAAAATAIHVINNIAEYRRDCVAFISPESADVINNAGSETEDVIEFRNSMPSSSFAVLDSGWKYMYDKYNDVYRYIPLNGDIAGCCAFTDQSRDPFFSPAGIDRGNIRNAIKLPFNPNKTQRDDLYKNSINPVTAMPGSGILLFGDKTLLAKPSAFDRINVRRLFILLEKSIARMANSFLFEFNDAFARSRFVATVEPFLRDIQGRGGVQDFAVVCDESNNSGDVVDRNEFRGDIYIKPSRSINFIQLQFVAVRSGVEFEEIIGG